MKSKTKIGKQIERKTNPELVETTVLAKKNSGWLEVAGVLSGSRRKRPSLNLNEISDIAKDGETIVIPGKVLSQGELNKKIKLIALNFSEGAKEKLINAKVDFKFIIEEIKSNPSAKNIRVLRGRD